MLPNIGTGELLVILVIALLLFGANRIPEVARSLGKSINAFKAGLKELSEDAPEPREASRPEPEAKTPGDRL